MEWINVDDRLPDEGEKVLTYRPGILPHTNYGIYEVETFRKGSFSSTRTYGDIVYWLPLPELPKEGEE